MDFSRLSINVNGLASFEEETFFIDTEALDLERIKELSLRADVKDVRVGCIATHRYFVKDGVITLDNDDLRQRYLGITDAEQAEWAAIGR